MPNHISHLVLHRLQTQSKTATQPVAQARISQGNTAVALATGCSTANSISATICQHLQELSAWPQARGLAPHISYQRTSNSVPQAPRVGLGGSCLNGWGMQIPGPPSAHEDCITAESSRGPPWLLQPAERQSRHFHVFSWLANQVPFLPHSCRHTGTGALSPCVTRAAVPHQGHSSKAHSRRRVCDSSIAAAPAGCWSRLAFVPVQVAPGEAALAACGTSARTIPLATAKGKQR